MKPSYENLLSIYIAHTCNYLLFSDPRKCTKEYHILSTDIIGWQQVVWLLISVYLHVSSLPVAHLSDAPTRRLLVTGDSARIQDETTESSAWFFNQIGHTEPRCNVSTERQLIIRLTSPGIEPTNLECSCRAF